MATYFLQAELVFVGVVLVFLLAAGIVATALFIRQWRREHKK